MASGCSRIWACRDLPTWKAEKRQQIVNLNTTDILFMIVQQIAVFLPDFNITIITVTSHWNENESTEKPFWDKYCIISTEKFVLIIKKHWIPCSVQDLAFLHFTSYPFSLKARNTLLVGGDFDKSLVKSFFSHFSQLSILSPVLLFPKPFIFFPF